MNVRFWCVIAALFIGGAAVAQDSGDGPMSSIAPDISDVFVDAPQFANAKSTFHRQRIHGDRALRDIAIYRGQGEVAAVMFDTLDDDVTGYMAKYETSADVIDSLSWFLPKNHTSLLGDKAEHTSPLTTIPYQRFRLAWPGGAGDCISFIRSYAPRAGRSNAAKRISGVYCRTVLSLDQAAITGFLDGIKTRR